MAKLMVMIDFPEIDYDTLSEAMAKHKRLGNIDFRMAKSKDGLEQVMVAPESIPLFRREDFVFELIGVRP